MKSKDIELGVGIDTLKFGMSQDEAKGILGEPTEINKQEHSEEDPDYISEEWHYDEIEMSIVFDNLEKMELTTMSVSSEVYTLEGKHLIGLERKQVMEIIGRMDLSPEWEEMPDDGPNNIALINEEDGISLYFEKGVLSEILWEML